MKLGAREHDEIMRMFENEYQTERLVRKDQDEWHRNRFYQDCRVNDLFLAFRKGYTFRDCLSGLEGVSNVG